GKYLFAAQLQPRSTSALSTTARIRFLLSITSCRSSRYRVVALTTPRMATADPFQGHPASTRGAIAGDRRNRIGRTARLVAAARRKDLRRALLPAAGDQDHQLRDHLPLSLSSAPASSDLRRP